MNKIVFPVIKPKWYKKIWYWLFRKPYRSYPTLSVDEIVSVQPMSRPSGLTFYMQYKYDGPPTEPLCNDFSHGCTCQCLKKEENK